jgi:hypothetical protein
MSDVRFLDRYTADQNQYLVVSFADGRKQHVRGPSSIFLDPVVHKSIQVVEAVSLNAFEAIVVYREQDVDRDSGIDASHGGEASQSSLSLSNNKRSNNNTRGDEESKQDDILLVSSSSPKNAGSASSALLTVAKPVMCNHDNSTTRASANSGRSVERRIIRGPTLFIPAANEWIHNFSWHGPSNPQSIEDRIWVKDALKLTKIRTLPDQLYYNVAACRTSDDAQLCVKLMVCYIIKNKSLTHLLLFFTSHQF